MKISKMDRLTVALRKYPQFIHVYFLFVSFIMSVIYFYSRQLIFAQEELFTKRVLLVGSFMFFCIEVWYFFLKSISKE